MSMKSDLKITYPGSEKVYVNGVIHPSVRVGMRMVSQMPTVSINDGVRIETPNQSIYIYDTSGPYGDANVKIDLNNGLGLKMPTTSVKCTMQRRALLRQRWNMWLYVKI